MYQSASSSRAIGFVQTISTPSFSRFRLVLITVEKTIAHMAARYKSALNGMDEREVGDEGVLPTGHRIYVLGEGRLTDALGRTADFTNTIIVLTSNLGVRESEGAAGFRRDDAERDTAFVRAAERFFRPEFFNRLDRVLPFHRLSRDHVRGIARDQRRRRANPSCGTVRR